MAVNYQDIGYAQPPPGGFSCSNCERFTAHDIEDALGYCSLLPKTQLVHKRGCCNVHHAPGDKKNPAFPEYPSSAELKKKLGVASLKFFKDDKQ